MANEERGSFYTLAHIYEIPVLGRDDSRVEVPVKRLLKILYNILGFGAKFKHKKLSEVNPTIYKWYLCRLEDIICVFSVEGSC